jgi:glucose/arabinose dehydrogenase
VHISQNRPPILAMPAHNAPLGVTFYDGTGCESGPGSFPCSMEGDAFVAYHGSWNSDIPVGYKVVHIPMSKSAPYLPTGEINDVLYEPDTIGCNNCLRPVNAVFNRNGHLIVSADATSEIFQVTYGSPPRPVRAQ